VVAAFKAKTGADVTHQYFDSEQAMLQLLRNSGGQIDVALPNIMYVKPAIDEGLLQPLDLGKIPNYATIFPQLKQAVGAKDGAVYAVPYVWGTNDLFYNGAAIATKLDSWAALWDPKFKGQVAWIDDPTASVFIAALYLKQDPYNPNSDDVRKALIELKANMKLIYGSADDVIKSYLNKSVTLGQIWSDAAVKIKVQDASIVSLAPKEGSVGWLDTWAIAKDAPNADLAYQWLNFMTSPEFQARWASDPVSPSPVPSNTATIAKLDPKVRDSLDARPERLDHAVMQKDVPQEQLAEWLEIWETVKAS
jgi:spermidine/putrescine-binding protein